MRVMHTMLDVPENAARTPTDVKIWGRPRQGRLQTNVELLILVRTYVRIGALCTRFYKWSFSFVDHRIVISAMGHGDSSRLFHTKTVFGSFSSRICTNRQR